MGNAPSSPAAKRPPIEDVMPPSQWKNSRFKVISPSSDLSNPSNFRAKRLQQTPVQERRRASKVMTLPEPDQFYFGRISEEPDNYADDVPSKTLWDKAERAKQAMAGCFEHADCRKVQPEKVPSQASTIEEKRLSRESSRQKGIPDIRNDIKVPQFDPDIPRTVAVGRDPHEEARDAAVVHNHRQSSKPRTRVHSPVAHLFQDSLYDADDAAPVRTKHEAWLETVLEIQADCKALQQQRLSVESQDTRDTLVAQSHSITNVDPHRDPEMNEGLRQSIQSDLQRQIDQQVLEVRRPSQRSSSIGRGRSAEPRPKKPAEGGMTRVERLRLQYQHELERMAHHGDAPKTSHVSKKEDSESIVQRHRKVFESRGSSLPASHRRQFVNNAKPRRSSSVPREKSSMPILLQLAGWEASKALVTSAPSTNVPVLLKLAGWTAPKLPAATKPRLSTQSGAPRLQGHATVKHQSKPARASDPMPLRSMTIPSRSATFAATKHVHSRPVRVSEDVSLARPMVQSRAAKNCPVEPRAVESRPVETQVILRRREPIGVTTAMMLQQTYPLLSAMTDDADDLADHGLYLSDNYRRNRHVQSQHALPSPAFSVDSLATVDSQATMPMVSEQASNNAAFLFSERTTMEYKPPSQPTSLVITTFDSHNRISGISHSVTIPISTSTSLGEPTRESVDSRRVRFSGMGSGVSSPFRIIVAPRTVSVPDIEPKMSDLTDNFFRDSLSTRTSDAGAVEPIPEVEASEDDFADDEKTATPDSVAIVVRSESSEKESTASSETHMRWSYKDNGVTPFRDSASVTHPTNSPYLRFQHARSKFSLKSPPVKRPSPVKRAVGGGRVHARIAAMENHRKASAVKYRRATMGPDVLAPRHSKLVSPLFPKKSPTQNEKEVTRSPTLVNGTVVESPEINEAPTTIFHDDEYGEIERANIINEDSDNDSNAETNDGDAFDSFLQVSDDDCEDTYDEATVSTVRQDRDMMPGIAQYAGYRLSNTDTSSRVSTASTVSTIQQQRLSFLSGDSYTSSNSGAAAGVALPFRDSALVKPNETNPGRTLGTLCLSPMQRTPMEARKWRALAKAAQENKSKSGKSMSKTKRSSLSSQHPSLQSIGY